MVEKNYRKLFAGINTPIALESGECIIPINFDNAATTPPFKCVNNSIMENILMYGSIGRGKGQKSEYCSYAYEESREFVLDFLNIKRKDLYSVVYVKNTTEGINLLAKALIKKKDDIIVTSRMEHHANDLPWRREGTVKYIEVDDRGKLDICSLEKLFKKYKGKIKVLSITGASNVTGYITNIESLASIAHSYGAKIVVDAAQLIAHRKISMEHIDFIVFSAHKMYAPFGSGAVVGLTNDLNSADPLIVGGGAVEYVLDEDVYWDREVSKCEAGTPNFLGVMGLISAMKSLVSVGFDNIEKHENKMREYAIRKMENMNRIILYGDSKEKSRLGVIPFNIDGIGHDLVAQKLADYRGVFVRHGGFCAHPYVRRLLSVDNDAAYHYFLKGEAMPGMVRASFGLYNTIDEIDEFIEVLNKILQRHG
ncbi:MAG: aminotransferase class V-fold PLP-dependent enzyme [Clostridium sp.]|uniref:aminotransferase class V-fold PLP-dependent enzyme n=1 Tax=Clostridium sp. TaxID=1506 RepID=UPI002FC6689C